MRSRRTGQIPRWEVFTAWPLNLAAMLVLPRKASGTTRRFVGRVVPCVAISLAAFLPVLAAPTAAREPDPAPKNLCTNGGFEKTEPYRGQEHPIGWFVMDPRDPHEAPISPDAHGGKRAGRMATDAKTVVGMNWDCPGLVEGTVRLWYKAMQSSVKGQNLVFYMLPMRDAQGMRLGQEIDPLGNASGRVVYRPPPEHVGDGRWHQAELEFDFHDLHAGHSVFAPRINEFTPATGSGEILLDDVEIIAAP